MDSFNAITCKIWHTRRYTKRDTLLWSRTLTNCVHVSWQLGRQCQKNLYRLHNRLAHMIYKKAQLLLTNPSDTKAYQKLLPFDMKTSCRQVNDLFEVMQQLSAPSGEWYWHILLQNSLFYPPHTCLTSHSGWTPCNINVTYTWLKSAFNGLQFCRDNTSLSSFV